MSISNLVNRATLEGNGVTTVLPLNFPFHTTSDLVVVQTVIATGAESTLVLDSDYTVSGAQNDAGQFPTGGEITFTTPPASTVRMVVYRDPPMLQGVVLQETGKIPVKAAIESPLDKLTMIDQRLSERIDRALRLSDGDSTPLGRLPAKTVRASRYLGFDGDGNPTMMQTPTGMVTSIAQLTESTIAALPAAGAAGLLRKVTDGARGVWMDTGTQWEAISGGWANVRDFGAKGDGVTDDTAALQNALSSGQSVFIPSGEYLTSNLTISHSGQRIIGAGWASILRQQDANQALLSVADGVSGLEIAHLKLKDAGVFDVAARGRALVYCNPSGLSTGVSGLDIHHVWFANGAISGISGNKILNSRFHHNLIDADGGACGEHGIYCGADSQRITIDHNTMISVGTSNGAGITSNATADNSVRDITVDSNVIKGFQWGISPASTSNYTQSGWIITNNRVIGTSDSTNSGIDLFAVKLTHSTISGNIVSGYMEHGFRTDWLFDSIVANNLFVQNKKCGIVLRGTQRCLFSGNICRDNDVDSDGTDADTSSGIRILNTNTVADNIFVGNVANVSNPANYQKYGISTGSGVANNYFLNNVVTPNRTADLDVGGAPGNFWTHRSESTVYLGDMAVSPVSILTGAGSPEGAASAPVGSLYLRNDGGANTSLYVKESGTGNTGWAAK